MTKRIEVRCYGCGETLDFTDSSCTKCGVMQVRLCECGKTVSAHADRCPACGAEMDLLEYAPSRRWMVVVLIVLVLAGVAYTAYRLFPGDPARERRRAFVEAADDYQAGRYSEAHLKFRRFIEKYDRDPRALYMLGISLHRLGREQDGVIFAREALDIDPSIEEAAVYLANHEFDRRNYDEARELCRQVLDHNPQYVGAHEILGKILTRPGFLNLPEAIRHLEFAARNQPQNRDADPEIYVLLGELNLALERSGLIEVDQDPRSATWIRQARESAAELLGTMDEADVHFFQARCDYALQNYGQAWIEIQKALNTGEKTPERRLLKAKLQWERQGRPEALRILDEISADSPDPEVLLEIVAFCRVQGLEERAARELASAHERHPNDVAVVLEVARDLAARGDFVAAEQELEALRVKHPEDERIIVALAETLFYQPGRELQGESLIEEFANREGPTSYAMIRWIDRLLDFEPGSPEAKTRTKRAARLLDEARAARSVNESRPVYMNFLRGKLYYRQRLYRDAREILRSVTSRAPDNISAHRLLAMVHQALGEADYEALELSVVLRIDGETPDLLVRRADAHFRDGSLRRSAADCKAALALAPRHTGASILLAQVLLATAPPDVDGAVECLRAAMAPEDAPVEVRVALARALMARGDLDDAESELDAARNLPTSNEARLLVVASRADLADLRSNSPFSAAAREIWTDHLKTHPGSMPSLLSFARILMNQGSYEQAKQWIGQAVARDPASVPARRMQFELIFSGGTRESVDIDRARSLVEGVRKLVPDSADDLYMRGKLALFESRDEEATALLARALDMAPLDGMIAYYAGLALKRCGGLDRARQALDRAVRLEPRLLSARLQLANVAFEQSKAHILKGDLSKAAADLQFTIRNSPEHMPARATLAEVFYRAGVAGDPRSLVQARQECEWLIARYPDPSREDLEGVVAPAYNLLGNICGAQGDLQGMLAACDRYLEIFPQDTQTRLRKAAALMDSGQSRDALALLKPLHLELPDDPQVLLALAGAYRSSGQNDEALATVERAVSNQPENASAWYILGRVLAAAGQTAKAEAKFRESLQLDPDLLAAADALTDLLIEADREDELIAIIEGLLPRTRYRAEIQYLLARPYLSLAPDSSRGLHLLQSALEDGFAIQGYRLWCTLVLLRVYIQNGDLADARAAGAAFSKWSRDHPDLHPGGPLAGPAAEAHFLSGLAQHLGNSRLNAEFHYRRAIRLAPDWAPPLVNLAELMLNDPSASEEALGLARRATDLEPGFAEAWDTLGSVYTEQGALKNAVAAFHRAVELFEQREPDARDSSMAPPTRRLLAETLTRKAQAEIDRGNKKQARASLRAAEQADPTILEWKAYQTALARLR